jgi:hypothetical protein
MDGGLEDVWISGDNRGRRGHRRIVVDLLWLVVPLSAAQRFSRSWSRSGHYAGLANRSLMTQKADTSPQNVFLNLRFGARGTQNTGLPFSALTFPSEGSHYLLARVDGAGLFCGSNGELVSFQLEEPDLGCAGQNLVPR